MDKTKKRRPPRLFVQFASAVACNYHIQNFFKGTIYTGRSKYACVPVLNCYSCPGAAGSCPIGSLQAVIGGEGHKFPFYVLGTLMLFGLIAGRFICGFLCPFGLIQDLLFRIKTPKIKVRKRPDKIFRYLKYVFLLLFVLIFPALFDGSYGIGDPWFCKYICPAGTLEGGIPLLLADGTLREAAGLLFGWKSAVLILILILSLLLYRPFCKYICPLGAFYSLFNRVSFIKLRVDKDKCVGCGKCERECKMGVPVLTDINCGECIRCGACKNVCPCGAINWSGGEAKLRSERRGES